MVENVIQIKSGIVIKSEKNHECEKDYIWNPVIVKMVNI